jgi:hypothetical protein
MLLYNVSPPDIPAENPTTFAKINSKMACGRVSVRVRVRVRVRVMVMVYGQG